MMKEKAKSFMVGLLACALIFCMWGVGNVADGAESVTCATGSINGKTMQLVFVDLSADLSAGVALSNNNVVSDKAAGDLLNEEADARGMRTVAAISGSGFRSPSDSTAAASYPDNYPYTYGSILKDGRLVNSSGSDKSTTIGFTPEGRVLIDQVSMVAKVSFEEQTVFPWAVNVANEDPSAILLFTSEVSLPVTCPPEARLFVIKDGVVTDVRRGGTFTVLPGTSVLLYNEASAATALEQGQLPKEGTPIEIATRITAAEAETTKAWEAVTDAVGGGTALILDNQSVVEKGRDSQSTTEAEQKSFAAVLRDGRLLLGTCVASDEDLAIFLTRLNAIDAVCLGGGSTSMLYAAEKGYLQVALSKLTNALVILEEDDSKQESIIYTALPTTAPVYINQSPFRADSYNVNGNNYFKLRDLAYVLNATNKRFEVTWDAPRNAINLTSGEYYTLVGGEMSAKGDEMKEAKVSQSRIYLDGETISLAAYLIDGNNYFKLRDLGRAMDFGVTWDEESATVLIDTRHSYQEE